MVWKTIRKLVAMIKMEKGWALKKRKRIRQIKRIIIHHSASTFGDAAEITSWHKDRGFKTIGYHYVINNGYPTHKLYKDNTRSKEWDGKVELGREDWEEGAHVKGHNLDSIGICLIGNNGEFTMAQIRALRSLVRMKLDEYFLSWDDVFCHSQLDEGKPDCPGFNINDFRAILRSID